MKSISILLMLIIVFFWRFANAQSSSPTPNNCQMEFQANNINYVYTDPEVPSNNLTALGWNPKIDYSVFNASQNPSYLDNSDLNNIRKPVIIVEGFDMFEGFTCQDIYNNYLNQPTLNGNLLASDLRKQGYDIITYNLSHGNVLLPIEINALILQQFIQHINRIKTTNEELIIIGVSMGGLIARQALTQMENDGTGHQTKLFISFDSPQKGANVPLSLQYMVKVASIASLFESSFKALLGVLNSRAAREMIIYTAFEITNAHVGSVDAYLNFYDQLKGLNNCNGYPKETNKVAISNGSLNGKDGFQKNIDGRVTFGGETALIIGLPKNVYNGVLNTVNSSRSYKDYNHVYVHGFLGGQTNYGNLKYDNPPIDNCPGGSYPWFSEVKNTLTPQGFGYISFMDNACFVPTNSAFDLNHNDISLDLAKEGKNSVLASSPFDDIWWSTLQENTDHTTLTKDIASWLYTQIINSDQNNKTASLDLQVSGQINTGEKKLYKATNKIDVGSGSLQTGSSLVLKAGSEINFTGDFDMAEGAELSAEIVPISLSKCISGSPSHYRKGEDIPEKEQLIENSNSQPFIYPNPSKGKLTLVLPEADIKSISNISITDIYGKCVYENSTLKSEVYEVDLTNQARGVYFIEVKSDKGKIIKKVILH